MEIFQKKSIYVEHIGKLLTYQAQKQNLRYSVWNACLWNILQFCANRGIGACSGVGMEAIAPLTFAKMVLEISLKGLSSEKFLYLTYIQLSALMSNLQ